MTDNPYKQFETNQQAELEGIWVDYGSYRIKVARAGGHNTKLPSALNKKLAPYKRAMETGTMPDEVANKIVMEAWCEHILLDWDSKAHGDHAIPGKDGKPIKFSKEAAIKLMTDLPDLFRDLRDKSMTAALFLEDIAEVDAKN